MRKQSLALLFIACFLALPAACAKAEEAAQSKVVDQKIKDLEAEGEQRQQEKRYPEAIMVYRRALKLDPNQPQMLSSIAYCYDQMGDSKKALDYYKQALALKPDLEAARQYVETHTLKPQTTY